MQRLTGRWRRVQQVIVTVPWALLYSPSSLLHWLLPCDVLPVVVFCEGNHKRVCRASKT